MGERGTLGERCEERERSSEERDLPARHTAEERRRHTAVVSHSGGGRK